MNKEQEINNSTIRAYRMTHATGFAPNPFGGYLTLATCKPSIRRCSKVGDWIIGVGSHSMGYYSCEDLEDKSSYNDKIIFVMKIKEIIPWEKYKDWCDTHAKEKLDMDSHGDCIYQPRTENHLKEKQYDFDFLKNKHHQDETCFFHDLSGKNVLIGDPKNSWYIGSESKSMDPVPELKESLKNFTQSAYGKKLKDNEWKAVKDFLQRNDKVKKLSELSEEDLKKKLISVKMNSELKAVEITDEIINQFQARARTNCIKHFPRVDGEKTVIFSRKGFDSTYGRYPNLIMADRTMIGLPIPERAKGDYDKKYSEIKLENGKTLKDLIKEMANDDNPTLFVSAEGNEVTASDYCHLDPQIFNYYQNKNFVPSLGQCEIPQRILDNHVVEGDLFIFFANFNEWNDRKKPLKHCCWGYMEIDKIFHQYNSEEWNKLPEYVKKNNPHSYYTNTGNNTIYVGTEVLSDYWCPGHLKGKLKGYGVFKYSDDVVLTAERNEKHRTIWRFSNDVEIIGKSQKKKPEDFENNLRISDIGQEFVVFPSCSNKDSEVMIFVKNLFNNV